MMTILESEGKKRKKKKRKIKRRGVYDRKQQQLKQQPRHWIAYNVSGYLGRSAENKTDKTKTHKQVTDCWGIILRSGRPSTEWIGGCGGGGQRIHREKKIRLPSKRAYWEHQFPSGAESDNNVLLGTFCKVSWDDGIHRTQILAAWLITHFRLPPAPNYPSGPSHFPDSYRQSCRFSPSRSVVLILVQFQLITELP